MLYEGKNVCPKTKKKQFTLLFRPFENLRDHNSEMNSTNKTEKKNMERWAYVWYRLFHLHANIFIKCIFIAFFQHFFFFSTECK